MWKEFWPPIRGIFLAYLLIFLFSKSILSTSRFYKRWIWRKLAIRQDWEEFQVKDICPKEHKELQNGQSCKTCKLFHFILFYWASSSYLFVHGIDIVCFVSFLISFFYCGFNLSDSVHCIVWVVLARLFADFGMVVVFLNQIRGLTSTGVGDTCVTIT